MTTGDEQRAMTRSGVGIVAGAGIGTIIGAVLGGAAIAFGIVAGAAVGGMVGAALDSRRRHGG